MSETPRPARIGRGIWRGIYSAMVDHPDFQALSADARLLLLVCRVGSQNTAASIFRYYREPLMAQTGLSAPELEAALGELEKKPTPGKPWIVRDGAVLWIRNGLKHDPNLSLQHEGHNVAIRRALEALPNTVTVQKFRRYYKFTRGRGEPRGTLPLRVGGSVGVVRVRKERRQDRIRRERRRRLRALEALRRRLPVTGSTHYLRSQKPISAA